MPQQQELNYALTLKDDATAVLQNFRSELNAGTATIQQHSGQISKMTDFYKAQRSEMREQSFMFKESRNAVQALSGSAALLTDQLGEQSGELKQLKGSLTSGLGIFQGVSFSMAALGVSSGGVTIAIAGLVAGASTLYSFLDRTAEHAAIAKKGILDLSGTLAGLSQGNILDLYRQKAAELASARDKLEGEKSAFPKVTRGFFHDPELEQTIAASEQQTEFYKSALKSDVELKVEDQARVTALQQQIQLLQQGSDIAKKSLQAQFEMNAVLNNPDTSDQVRQLAIQRNAIIQKQLSASVPDIFSIKLRWDLDDFKTMTASEGPLLLASIHKAFGADAKGNVPINLALAGIIDQKEIELQQVNYLLKNATTEERINELIKERIRIQADLKKLEETELEKEAAMLNLYETGLQSIASGLDALGVKSDTWASKLMVALEQFVKIEQIQNSINQLEEAGKTTSWLNYIPMLGSALKILALFHEGGIVPKAHTGMFINAPASQEFPIMVRGGETVRTERQEARLQNGMSGAGGRTYVTIQALDAGSFNDFLRDPGNRNVLISRINDALRKGITGTLN